MQQIGLFFGSFNPIHIGHLALANYMAEFEGLDEVWFVVSPQNPFKETHVLIDAQHRLNMVNQAIQAYPRIKAEDIELSLPIPSYTIDTLRALKERHPEHQFYIIMGEDNIHHIDRWKEADQLIGHYPILVYPRKGHKIESQHLPVMCKVTQAPVIEMASSDIRAWIQEGKELPFFVSAPVMAYIKAHQLYQKTVNSEQ